MSEDGPSREIDEPAQAVTLAVEVVRHGGAWEHTAISDPAVELAAHAAFTEAPPAEPAPYEITIALTDDAEMRDLNRTWRGKDQPTNVLSFPAGDAPGEHGALGDVVIAYETTQREAEEAGIALSDHVSHLVVHGVLHLLGFDHLNDDEAEQMEDLERKALASLGIADPYTSEAATEATR
jgi:probable rRNA maturation factor